ncbi:uncharacterized protein CCOS01_00636 [Colletotrichum costaricense]|nr:uncharacterized protein CCOS01_00636 [Colletotrichum costaricense]KAK1539322.1 hypothetical protein CCOS01_00636 [Colletotrichum costaricense]
MSTFRRTSMDGRREGVGLSEQSCPGRDGALQVPDKTPLLPHVIRSDGGAFCMWLTLPTAHSDTRPATSLATWTTDTNFPIAGLWVLLPSQATIYDAKHEFLLASLGCWKLYGLASASREESETPTRPLRVFPPPWGMIVVVRVGVGDLDEAVDAQNSKRQYDNPMADSGNVRKPFPRESLLQRKTQSGAAISR